MINSRGERVCDLCAAARAQAKAVAVKEFVAGAGPKIPSSLIPYRRAVNRGPYCAGGLDLCRKHLRELTGC